MELYLQMGHGMQAMSLEMIKNWGGGKVIISPVNIKRNELQPFSEKIAKLGGEVLFDPQMFYPKDGHDKLTQYEYWPDAGISIDPQRSAQEIMRPLLKINKEINAKSIILPNMEMMDKNMKSGFKFIESAAEFCGEKTDNEKIVTICFYPEILRSKDKIESIIEKLLALPVEGFYIIPHPPNGEYIISDALWMTGMLKILVCLKHAKKKVIVGYSNHQGLVYSISKIDAIASGNFMNTRSFTPSRFQSQKENEDRRKSNWFYQPTAMNEYKVTSLDVAKQRNFLELFEPLGKYKNKDSEVLFKGAYPTSTSYREPNSFRHYLHCLKIQCETVSGKTFDETYNSYEFMLQSAEQRISEIRKHGIKGVNRDFSPAFETNRVAACSLMDDYGFKTRLEWDNM